MGRGRGEECIEIRFCLREACLFQFGRFEWLNRGVEQYSPRPGKRRWYRFGSLAASSDASFAHASRERKATFNRVDMQATCPMCVNTLAECAVVGGKTHDKQERGSTELLQMESRTVCPQGGYPNAAISVVA